MRKRLIAVTLVMCMVMAVGPFTFATDISSEESNVNITYVANVPGVNDYNKAYAVFEMLNEYRVSNGKSPLTLDEELQSVAMQRAAECAVRLSHTRPDHSYCTDIFPAGRTGCENIAGGNGGSATAIGVMDGWKKSECHNRNMLDERVKSVGIGCFQNNNTIYWVQTFSYDDVKEGTPRLSGIEYANREIIIADDLLNEMTTVPSSAAIQIGETENFALRNINEGLSGVESLLSPTYAEIENTDIATVEVNGSVAMVTAKRVGNITLKLGLKSTKDHIEPKMICVPITVSETETDIDRKILSLSPANGATDVGYDASDPPVFQITFDREIASLADQEFVADVDLTLEDTFAIHRKSDDQLIYKPSVDSKFRFTLTSDKKTLVVTPMNNHALLNANTEYYVTMGEGFVRFADSSISPAINKRDWTFKTVLFEKDGIFTFPGSNGKNIEYSYYYSDNFFYNTSDIYNHDLANMSLNLAMSAFNSLEASASNYNEFVAAKNVRKLLSDLNFNGIETNIDNGNNSYSGMPYTNSIAAAYAKKNITTDYGDFTLIAVAIRGGGYEAEWGGNFAVGQNGNHKGFQLASDKVLAGLKEYINSQSISGDIKIWITGYSRAAATANLTAASIDDGKLFIGTNAVDNSVVRLSTADVYAYTFETPMGTTNNTSSFLYNNIFNIVNPIDLVPKVAPDAWNFGRYGITYYMPSGDTDAVGYSDVIMRVTREYSKIVNGADNGSLLAIKQLTNQSAILDKFLDILSTQMPRTTYSPKYEHLLVPIASEVMGADGNQYGENIFWAIEEFCLRYPDDAADLVNALKKAVGNKIVWYIVAEQGFEQLYKAFSWNGSTAVDTMEMIGEIIFQSHYPEVTMAWMRTINGADGYGSGKYRKLYVNCPVDVSVYDGDNRLVAQIVNDDPQIIEDSLIGSYIDGDGQKIVILPTDMEYHVAINATDNGIMTYTVDEYDIDKATTERIVSYSEIGITKGEVLTGLVENLDDVQKANYPLYRENETTPLKPDINNEGDGNNQPNDPTQPSAPPTPNYGGGSPNSSPIYSITIPGRVTGGTVIIQPTNASAGSKVTITVSSDSSYQVGSVFITDNDGKQVTVIDVNDNTYVFTMPNSNVTVDVLFKKIWENPFSDVAEDAWYYDSVKFVSEKGLMQGTGEKTFAPGATLSRAMLAQILYNNEGRPAAKGEGKFSDVSGGWYAEAVAWAGENGIVTGNADGTFSPNGAITREQIAVILYRYAQQKGYDTSKKADLSAFADAETISDYAKEAMAWANAAGLINGMDETTLAPVGNATRAQVAAILMRFLESTK